MKKTIFAVLACVLMLNATARAEQNLFGTTMDLSATTTAATMAAEPQASSQKFAQGTWVFTLYGSAAIGHNSGDIYTAHVGVGYHVIDNLSINLELIGGLVDFDSGAIGTEEAYGINLLIRWHFYKEENWSVYVDGLGGMLWTGSPFPAGGTHQNFTPQVGLGFTYDLNDSISLMAGARWHHVSNAGRTDNNPGTDGAIIYFGVMVPF